MAKRERLAGTTARALAREAAGHVRRLLDGRIPLPARAPERIIVAPPDPVPGEAELATTMYGGTFPLAGVSVETYGESPFTIENAPYAWYEALHGFGWMRHHRASNTELAQLHVRTLLEDWIKLYGEAERDLPWRPLIAATRLRHWISHSPVVLGHGDFAFLDVFLKQLAVHHRFVRRAARDAIDPFTRARLLATLCTVALAFPTRRQEQRRLSTALAQELDAQVLDDGGHISRRAAAALDLAGDLLPLVECYDALGLVTPAPVIRALDRMLPTIALHQHRDRSLARHNGTRGARVERTEAVLALSPSRGLPPAEAPQSGYQRLAMGETVVVVDTGITPPIEHASRAHAATLSFEMSVGEGDTATPLIVNIGHIGEGRDKLRNALRTVGAHSTLSVDGADDPWSIPTTGLQARLFAEPLLGGPTEVDLKRADAQDGSWRGFRASHDAYARQAAGPSAIHVRTFALSDGGAKLAGRDELTAPVEAGDAWSPPPATVRFHLHPAVTVRADEDDPQRFLLKPERGAEWALSVEGATGAIDESIYVAHDSPEDARQIVLTIPEGVGAANWTLTRL